MPSYSPDVSLDTILAGVTAGTQSMLQGIVNGALQRQEIEIAKQKLKAYEKQVEAQEKAQDIAMKRLALEQAEAATALLQNQANLAGQPVTVPGQTIEALGLPPTKKVKKTVVTTEDIKTQQQEQLPITKGQLPQQPQKPVGETPYDRLLKKGIPKSVKAIFEQLLRSDTFKNLKKRGEIPAGKRPIDLTPKELELWADTAKAPKGSKYNATYNFLKNLQKAKQQSEQQVIQPQGTITKSYTEPHVEKETKIEEKVAEEPWKIYPQVGETGEPPLLLDRELEQSLQQQFPYVSPEIIIDSAKYYTNSQYNEYLRTLNTLNQNIAKLKTTGELNLTDLNRDITTADRLARSYSGLDNPMNKFIGESQKLYKDTFDSVLKEKIRYYQEIGAPKSMIDYLKSYTFEKRVNDKIKAFEDTENAVRSRTFNSPSERNQFRLEYLRKNYGLEYNDMDDYLNDVKAVKRILEGSSIGVSRFTTKGK